MDCIAPIYDKYIENPQPRYDSMMGMGMGMGMHYHMNKRMMRDKYRDCEFDEDYITFKNEVERKLNSSDSYTNTYVKLTDDILDGVK